MQPVSQEMISIWKAHSDPIDFPVLNEDITVDVAVIGGGITGITTADLLSKKGFNVAVFEAWKIGESTTGYSTGNLYGIVDERLYRVKSKFDSDTVRKVTSSRLEAVNHIEKVINDHGIECDFGRRPWYLYTESEDKVPDLEKEFKACEAAGLPVVMVDHLPLPFNTVKSIYLPDQAQFNPMQYVKHYANIIQSQNCRVFENTVVLSIDQGETCILKTKSHTVKAKHVVHATHIPKGFLLMQTLLGPYREYGVALKLADNEYPPHGIYWSLESGHHHSVRVYEKGIEKYLIVVGAPHKVGQKDDDNSGFEDLLNYAKNRFNTADVAYMWAAQHYRPADGLPYVGLGGEKDPVYYATGFGTDGLVYGTVSARIIADHIAGIKNPYEEIYTAARFKPAASSARFIKENINTAGQYLKDITDLLHLPEIKDLSAGEGAVIGEHNKRVAVYKDEKGALHGLSPVCPHLGCVVNWNGIEKTWDCPCHGSRFTIDGDVIEGPAFNALHKIELEGLVQ
jgi:glycine/D-amino acid oxidase-like deaminating enzyme/nitrite reductase/ring-hydroxylating ferredoxin subunit